VTEEVETERVNMNWPTGLKERVRELVGTRGLTGFVVEAVETRLSGEDRVKSLEKEVDELRYLAQLLADRYVMGGDHEDREAFLMELELPTWLRTDGWPTNLARQVPKPDAPPVHVPKPPAPVVGQAPSAEKEYTEEELRRPSYEVARREAGKSPAPADPEIVEAVDTIDPDRAEGPTDEDWAQAAQEREEAERPAPMGRDNPAYEAPSDDFLARVQAKAAEKGIDLGGAGLKTASSLEQPHNHAFERTEDGNLRCACGTVIDQSTTPPTLTQKAEVTSEPAPALEVPSVDATPVAPARTLDNFEVDF